MEIERWKAIYECAGDEPQNKTTLSELAHKALKSKVGINLICSDIDLMVQEGYLFQAKGNNNAKLLTQNPEKIPGSSKTTLSP